MNALLYVLARRMGRLARPLVKSCPDDLEAVARAAGVLSDAAASDPVGDYRAALDDYAEWAGMPDEGLAAARQAFADFDAAYADPDFRLWAKELRT